MGERDREVRTGKKKQDKKKRYSILKQIRLKEVSLSADPGTDLAVMFQGSEPEKGQIPTSLPL